MPRPPDPRREALRKFAQRHKLKPGTYNSSGVLKPDSVTKDIPINTPDDYETAKRLPAGQKITHSVSGTDTTAKPSAAQRRLQRRNAGVSDVRTASDAQIRRLRRLGLL